MIQLRRIISDNLGSIFFVLAMFALVGCTNKPEGPVIIGTNVWPGYEPGHLAKSQNLYGNADVNLRQFLSASEVLRAFRNRSIDVAALTLDEALQLQQSGIDIQIFLVTDVSFGADAVLARPPVKSVADLVGKKVGVKNAALGEYVLARGEYVLARALQINAVQNSDVNTVPLTVDETVRLYRDGALDAVVTFEPFKTELQKLGAVKIFDSRQIPNEIVDVLVTRKDFAKANPNAIKAVTTGWLAAAKLIKELSPDAIKETAVRLGISDQELRNALLELKIQLLADNQTMLSGKDGQIAQASLKLIPVLEQRNKVKFAFRPEEIITPDFLPDAPAK